MFASLFRRSNGTKPAPESSTSPGDRLGSVLTGRVTKNKSTTPPSRKLYFPPSAESEREDTPPTTPAGPDDDGVEGECGVKPGEVDELQEEIKETVEQDDIEDEGEHMEIEEEGGDSEEDEDEEDVEIEEDTTADSDEDIDDLDDEDYQDSEDVADAEELKGSEHRYPTEDDTDPLHQDYLPQTEVQTEEGVGKGAGVDGLEKSSPIPIESVFDEEEDGEEEDDEIIPESDEERESEWEIDEEELDEYQTGKKEIIGHERWTRDENKLHKLLSLRGLHPLMPASWSKDFLGVPMYPSLFAPVGSKKPVVIHHKAGQFRATKALRNIFDLQSRISGLRQVGLAEKIARTIEMELNRYIKWAMQDAGLDRYEFMSNISIKKFDKADMGKRNLAKSIQTYFQDWAAEYRTYYAERPGVRPPRLLYGLVVIQHAVMLLTIDSVRPRAKPRCFADFNMSQENQWLDSSLNVAIPVHLARERLLNMANAGGLSRLKQQESSHEDD